MTQTPSSGAADAAPRSIWRRRFLTVLAVVVVPLVGLAVVGPEPLESCPYVNRVTATSAVVAIITGTPARVRVTATARTDGTQHTAFGVTGTMHALRLAGLQSGATYDYVVEGIAGNSSAAPLGSGSFRTAPTADDTPVHFAAVGDSGAVPWWYNLRDLGWTRLRTPLSWLGQTPQWNVAREIAELQPEFFVHLGDLVYRPRPRPAYPDAFFLPFAPVLQTAGIYTVPGNHDIVPHDRHSYFEIFAGRPEQAADHGISSWPWGPLRLVLVDTTSCYDWRPGTASAARLDAVLREAMEPWIVVAMHHPGICASRHAERADLKDVWDLLHRYAVDLVISGDDHNYQQFEPFRGVVQVVVGGGGKSIYEIKDDPRLAGKAESLCFLDCTIDGARLVGRIFADDGTPLDEFSLDKKTAPVPDRIPEARRVRIERLMRGQ